VDSELDPEPMPHHLAGAEATEPHNFKKTTILQVQYLSITF
jgi:hypothetical protein